jgi:hypothetical protein
MEKKNIELATFNQVSNSKMPDSKDPKKMVNKYPNEKLREYEVKNRLKENVAYQELLEKEDLILHDTHMAKIELDYMKDSLKSIGILVELMKLE